MSTADVLTGKTATATSAGLAFLGWTIGDWAQFLGVALILVQLFIHSPKIFETVKIYKEAYQKWRLKRASRQPD